MLCPLLIFSQSDYLIQVVDTNSHTLWQTMQTQISWLLQKPSDLGLCCLQMQGISMFSRTRVNSLGANNKIVANDILKHFQITFFGEDICISSRMAASHKGNNLLPKETNYFLKRVCQFRTDTSTFLGFSWVCVKIILFWLCHWNIWARASENLSVQIFIALIYHLIRDFTSKYYTLSHPMIFQADSEVLIRQQGAGLFLSMYFCRHVFA